MCSNPSSRPRSVTRLSLSHITAQNETNRLARRAAIIESRRADAAGETGQ